MLEIIYQDDWLVAVNKPSGWLVHRSWLDRDEKVVVMQTVRDQIGQHVFTAHRLDRPTSGVLLMGLSSEAGRLLAQQFEQHQIRKRYHAIVRGWLMEEALLDYPLVEELDRIADKFAREDKGPQPAVTHYRGLATVEMPVATGRYPTSRYGLVELEPKTGRKHQLRRHLAHLRHPILGDSKHGDLRQNRSAAEHFGCHRLMLHASELSLTHPFTGEPLTLRAGFDDVWMRALSQFGWRGLLPLNERVEFADDSGQDEENKVNPGDNSMAEVGILSAPCTATRCWSRKKRKRSSADWDTRLPCMRIRRSTTGNPTRVSMCWWSPPPPGRATCRTASSRCMRASKICISLTCGTALSRSATAPMPTFAAAA